jgi:hypothetical protein
LGLGLTTSLLFMLTLLFGDNDQNSQVSPNRDTGGGRAVTIGFLLVLISIYAIIVIPIHAAKESRAHKFQVLDNTTNGTWTGCFTVSTPVDRWGFSRRWCEMQKQRLENILPVA